MSMDKMEKHAHETIDVNEPLFSDDDEHRVMINVSRWLLSIYQDVVGDEKFEAGIGFSKQLDIGFNIIGREDIFERFKVCFDEKEKVIEFYNKI